MLQHPILVIGSTGKVGSRVSSLLTAAGVAVRPVSRRSDPRFDWTEPSTWPGVLNGVKSAFVSFYPDLAMLGAEAIIEQFTRCAEECGVEHIVLLSGRGEQGAERCESIVQKSEVRCSVVRCSWFYQNFTEGMLRQAVLDGTLALPAGEVAEPFVDVDDIADVAVAALLGTTPPSAGRQPVFEVTGPRLMTFSQVAEELSRATDRNVNYISLSADDFRAGLAEVAGPEMADLFTGICTEVFAGHNQWLGDGVERALGRAPRDFNDFCQAAVTSGAWSA